jgi:hypothetical protein
LVIHPGASGLGEKPMVRSSRTAAILFRKDSAPQMKNQKNCKKISNLTGIQFAINERSGP